MQYTDSTNEGESEEDASILTRGTEIVSVKGEDGQQYVLLEKIYLGGQKQKNCTSTNVSLKHVDQSSCKYKLKLKLKLNYIFKWYYSLYST